MNEIIKETAKQVIREIETPGITNIVGIYSGRFQPFGKHHFKTFEWFQKLFGTKNTYVVTSNKVDGNNSPFNFREKKVIIGKHGVPISKIVQVKNPYKSEEVTSKYDPKSTAVVFLVGKKDSERLGGKYFLPYDDNRDNLVGFDQHAYYKIAPHYSSKVDGKELSGTTIREILGSIDKSDGDKKSFFEELMGFTDERVYNLVTSKLSEKIHGIPFVIKKKDEDDKDIDEMIDIVKEVESIVIKK